MNEKENKSLLGFYNYTVVLTYIGMVIGCCGIMFAMKGRCHQALFCLMIAGLCDMFDGTVASTKKDRTKDEKMFGIQIDSLSDLLCFGMLPACIVYGMNTESDWLLVIPCFFVLCGLIRLAYFNVDETNRQGETSEGRQYYQGLPITSSALLLPAVFELCVYLKLPMFHVGMGALFVIGIAYILPFRLKKIHLCGKIVMIVLGIVEFILLVRGVV